MLFFISVAVLVLSLIFGLNLFESINKEINYKKKNVIAIVIVI